LTPAMAYPAHPMMMGYPHAYAPAYPQPTATTHQAPSASGVQTAQPTSAIEQPTAVVSAAGATAPLVTAAGIAAATIASSSPIQAAPAALSNVAVAPPTAPVREEATTYNPLQEIVSAARRRLAIERPVTILVMSVEGERHAAATVQALDRMLGKHGETLQAALSEEMRTRVGLTAAVESLSGAVDFLVFNAGRAGPESAELSAVSDLTVLVATDDLEDPRVDDIAELIGEAESFIVSASSAQPVSAML
jgi:hypothetical protein